MPTGYTPIFSIRKDGEDITARFNDRCTSIEIDLQNGGGASDVCKIVLDDRDWAIASPDVGANIEVYLGYKEVGLAWMGLFEIGEVSYDGPPRTISIVGQSAGQKSVMKSPRIKEFENKTLGDILGDIAKESGLTPQVSESLANQKIPFLNQFASNYHLVHELERRFGAIAKFEGGRLIFKPRDEGTDLEGNNMPILVLRDEHFLRWHVKHTERAEYEKVKASYHDKLTHTRQWVESKNEKFAGEKESGQDFLINKLFPTKEEAEAAAKARAQSFARAASQFDAQLARGDPWIRDQQPMLVGGMREGIRGSYVIDVVKHTYRKNEGILSQISAKPPGTQDEYSDQADSRMMSVSPGATIGEFLLLNPTERALSVVGQVPGL